MVVTCGGREDDLEFVGFLYWDFKQTAHTGTQNSLHASPSCRRPNQFPYLLPSQKPEHRWVHSLPQWSEVGQWRKYFKSPWIQVHSSVLRSWNLDHRENRYPEWNVYVPSKHWSLSLPSLTLPLICINISNKSCLGCTMIVNFLIPMGTRTNGTKSVCPRSRLAEKIPQFNYSQGSELMFPSDLYKQGPLVWTLKPLSKFPIPSLLLTLGIFLPQKGSPRSRLRVLIKLSSLVKTGATSLSHYFQHIWGTALKREEGASQLKFWDLPVKRWKTACYCPGSVWNGQGEQGSGYLLPPYNSHR